MKDVAEDEEIDVLSDSDVEEEREVPSDSTPRSGLNLTTTTSRASDNANPPRAPSPPASAPHSNDGDHEVEEETGRIEDGGNGLTGYEHAEEPQESNQEAEVKKKETPARVTTPPARQREAASLGPKKTRVVIRDAAWSTWWAVLYWVSRFYWPV